MLIRVYRHERTTPRAAHRTTGRHPKRKPETAAARHPERTLIMHYLTKQD